MAGEKRRDQMSKLWLSNPLLIGISMLIGSIVALLAPVTLEGVRDEYDRSHPVWEAESTTLVRRDGATATVRIIGTKARDCDLLRTWAQALYGDQPATDAVVQRTGGRAIGYINRPLGRQDIGEFIVAPIPEDAHGLVIHVEHTCGGRVVLSTLGRLMFRDER